MIYFDSGKCTDCPVHKKTRKTHCNSSPYVDVNLAYHLTLSEDVAKYHYNPPNLDAVEAEIEFLIALLPPKSKEAKSYIL